MNPRVDAASAASHAAEIRILSARNLLGRDRPLNGCGAYGDRIAVLADLNAAIRDLSAAAAGLHIEWPTLADYLEELGA
jgi:small ligand-binding sensory domain FIST